MSTFATVIWAFVTGFLAGILTLAILVSPQRFRREADLPAHCVPGEVVQHTSVTPSRIYRCEGQWRLE